MAAWAEILALFEKGGVLFKVLNFSLLGVSVVIIALSSLAWCEPLSFLNNPVNDILRLIK